MWFCIRILQICKKGYLVSEWKKSVEKCFKILKLPDNVEVVPKSQAFIWFK